MRDDKIRPIVGLDIGSTGLRAAQLGWDRKAGAYRVERIADQDLPPGIVEHGVPVDTRQLAKALKRLWRAGRFRTRHVVVGVPDSTLLTRQVDLPWMPPTDFAAALRYQVEDVLPVDPQTAALGYHVLAEVPSEGEAAGSNDNNRILLVSGDRTAMENLADVLRRGGLQVDSADSTALALMRADQNGVLRDGTGVRAIADLGASHLTVSVMDNGQPVLLRSIADIGGAAATAQIADKLDLPIAEAEDLKRRIGLNGPPPEVAPLPESSVFGALPSTGARQLDERAEVVMGVLNSWATTVVSELRNSLDYYRRATPSSTITRLTLVGRGMDLDGMTERVATQITVPLTKRGPFLGLEAVKSASKHIPGDTRMAAAVGLAMGRPR